MAERAVGLFSGGLDSLLAAKLLKDQGIEVTGVVFQSPFFGPERALAAADQIGLPLEVRDVTDLILPLVEDPPHGHGKNLNPCIDCHAMMFHEAGRVMEGRGASFLFSGEVLGQRPFSQNYKALLLVARLSGYEGWILRPLSAKLLPRTRPEAEGLVDREELLDIQGRSRSRQMALAYEWGIREYPSPAGGCSLTDPGFAGRLRDLLEHEGALEPRQIELVKLGRHFRLGEHVKVIVGRKHAENVALDALRSTADTRLEVSGVPGPVVLVVGSAGDGDVEMAARLAVRYSDAPVDEEASVVVDRAGEATTLKTSAARDEDLERFRI